LTRGSGKKGQFEVLKLGFFVFDHGMNRLAYNPSNGHVVAASKRADNRVFAFVETDGNSGFSSSSSGPSHK